MVLFQELLGDKLGQFVNVLVLLHLLALFYWIYRTVTEQSSSNRGIGGRTNKQKQ